MSATRLSRPLRKDPRPRASLDGSAVWGRLRDTDPNKHYVYVNKGDPEAVANYEFLGYEPVTARQGGVRPAGGRTVRDGENIEMRGMVLYEIDRKEQQRIDLEGIDGTGGQKAADELMASIIDRNVSFDSMRGQGGIRYVNEIEALKQEVVRDG